MALPQLDIDRLTAEERMELAERLWDSLSEAPEAIPLTPAQQKELDRRLDAFLEDRYAGEPWREALAKISRSSG